MQKATFAGGCFWCMVSPFEEQPGIHGILSGYMGGELENPTYEQVLTGETGHLEVVQITYDDDIFPYEKLLELYWPQIDPTDAVGQGNDQKSQYRAAILYHTEEQRELALQSREALAGSGRFDKPVVTAIEEASVFYPAEEYHQNYHRKNPEFYKESRIYSGREAIIEKYWK
ncbi:peptide-methionine (S)-S-oxide reductase [Paenibacillus sp. BIHB 4019]|uniref:Peptide methionine sulfoxide reductase MsrA n=1 Tax=Paenibacillus sp. BIHB 4019 TaxID=1870819 RepID=A0A1B2DSN4_9BACL|nr:MULTISPECIES: peptide-methionine (S)-S-oxide reductase MsrA [unclassified Paenibacillus]ANY70717.1 peptide-methionine (S)-S-oxide reductase [Paenibacillus sp. BIHB 4019]KQO16715.1 methionine sulfoxide reductase A [Paenibacillus sp. Leaf72]